MGSRLSRPKAKPKPRPLVLPDSSLSLFRGGNGIPSVSSPLSSSPCSSLSPSTLNSPAPSSSPSVSSHNHALTMSKAPHSPSLQTPFFGNFPAPIPSPSLYPNYPSPFMQLATPLPHPHSHALNTAQLHFWSSLSPLAVANSPRYPINSKGSGGGSSGSANGGDSGSDGPPSSAALLSAFPSASALPSLSPSHFTFPVPAFPFTAPLSFSNSLRSPLFTPGPHLPSFSAGSSSSSGRDRKEQQRERSKEDADHSETSEVTSKIVVKVEDADEIRPNSRESDDDRTGRVPSASSSPSHS